MTETLQRLAQTRDRVLDGARIDDGEGVADVGAGTGLLALGAAERVGPEGDVIALDISVDALEELRRNAAPPNISYLIGSADVLPLPDASVDAVVTRSVLIYVDDKAEASREFARVLRSGGRVSLFEPINRRNLRITDALDFSPLGELAERLRAVDDEYYANPRDPMLNFDENDLERHLREARLVDVDVELRADEHELPGERYLNFVGAPDRPSVLERWRGSFSADDVARLVDFVAAQTVPARITGAFVTARKP